MEKHDEEARVEGYGDYFVSNKNYFAQFVCYAPGGLCNRRGMVCGAVSDYREIGSIARLPGF
jgi:hypothetical protein